MNMIYVVRHLSRGIGEAEFVLSKGEILRVGCGGDVDCDLTASADFPKISAHIWNGDEGYDGCILENISRKDSHVFLNGNPVHSVALLEGGDIVQIGVDRFQIFCHKEKTASEVSSPPVLHRPQKTDPPKTILPQINYTVQTTVVNAALHKFMPIDRMWSQNELLTQVCRRSQVILFANFRLAGVVPGAPELVGPDRFQDAVIIGLPEGDVETCLAASKLFWGWFARPSVLEMSITRGSRELCKKIMEPFRGLLVKPQAGTADWVLYAKSESTIADLLFSESTIVMT